MTAPKCQPADYIDFMVASPKVFSCTEAAASQPASADPPAHDAFNRLLYRLEPDPAALWWESRDLVNLNEGALVLDDSTLDKPYAKKIELVTHHWSGKHKAVVSGINLITMLWTDGDKNIPCDYRIYDKSNDSLTKNDHFRAMLASAAQRGFVPKCVLFDSWYSGLDNLKAVRKLGWTWLTRLKSNRKVNLDREGLKATSATAISASGTVVHLQGYGLIRVFKIVPQDGGNDAEDAEYWATSDLGMSDLTRLMLAELSWGIENYHRGLKQCCGVERCQARGAKAQRNHIGLAIRAFLQLEHQFFTTGISWYEAKIRLIRAAIAAYIANPHYRLPQTA